MVDKRDPTLFSEQVARSIERDIRDGKYDLENPLPSEVALQATYGVARGTVRAALALLRERGVVETMPFRGTFIARK
jgi:GntR family transcriptional regulator